MKMLHNAHGRSWRLVENCTPRTTRRDCSERTGGCLFQLRSFGHHMPHKMCAAFSTLQSASGSDSSMQNVDLKEGHKLASPKARRWNDLREKWCRCSQVVNIPDHVCSAVSCCRLLPYCFARCCSHRRIGCLRPQATYSALAHRTRRIKYIPESCSSGPQWAFLCLIDESR